MRTCARCCSTDPTERKCDDYSYCSISSLWPQYAKASLLSQTWQVLSSKVMFPLVLSVMDFVIDPHSQLFMVYYSQRDKSSKMLQCWRGLPKSHRFDLGKNKKGKALLLNVPSNFPRVVVFIFIYNVTCMVEEQLFNFIESLVAIFLLILELSAAKC